jgi:transmembrane 9 superfamily protein 2/4
VTTSELLPDGGRGEVTTGFPVGFKAPAASHDAPAHSHGHPASEYYINNHLTFRVLLHRAEAGLPRQPSLAAAAGVGDASVLNVPTPHDHEKDEDPGWLVVGFEVEPCSVAREALGGLPPYDASSDREAAEAAPRLSHAVRCAPGGAHARIAPGETLAFTYSFRFEASPIPWNQRWDAYLNAGGDSEVHWFSIFNSMLLVLALGALIALILARAVRRDLLTLELGAGLEAGGDASRTVGEDAGWKLLRSDAFRAPEGADWLAVGAGSGAQVLCVTFATAVLGALGFASPASRGALLTTALLLYPLSAGAAGYVAVRALAWAHAGAGPPGGPPGAAAAAAVAAGWRTAALRTASLLSGFAAASATAVNIAVRFSGGEASGAVPFSLFSALFALWFLVSLPLALIGGYTASRQPPPSPPCRCCSAIARHVPPGAPSLAWTALAGGALPFGAAFVELHFALGALWQQRAYYAPGFALLALLLAAALAAESAAVLTYAALNAEEHRWWWRAFVAGGAPALYAAAYVTMYAAVGPLNLTGFAAVAMYSLYSATVLAAAFCAGGALGLAASLALVNYLFAQSKGD